MIDKAYSAPIMNTTSFNNGVEHLLQNGYHQKTIWRCFSRFKSLLLFQEVEKELPMGQVIPMIPTCRYYFLVMELKQGETYKPTEITDIAPTISALLDIAFPNANIGVPLDFVFD